MNDINTLAEFYEKHTKKEKELRDILSEGKVVIMEFLETINFVIIGVIILLLISFWISDSPSSRIGIIGLSLLILGAILYSLFNN